VDPKTVLGEVPTRLPYISIRGAPQPVVRGPCYMWNSGYIFFGSFQPISSLCRTFLPCAIFNAATGRVVRKRTRCFGVGRCTPQIWGDRAVLRIADRIIGDLNARSSTSQIRGHHTTNSIPSHATVVKLSSSFLKFSCFFHATPCPRRYSGHPIYSSFLSDSSHLYIQFFFCQSASRVLAQPVL
jgi:hypothetical protein